MQSQLCEEIDTDAETGAEMNYFNCEALSVNNYSEKGFIKLNEKQIKCLPH